MRDYNLKSYSTLFFLIFAVLLQVINRFTVGYVKQTQIKLATRLGRKYILQWTNSGIFKGMSGTSAFVKRNCSETNCYLTSDKKYFKNITNFDYIIFNGPYLSMNDVPNPLIRSPKQLYVFESAESSHIYSICDNTYDGFFNLTFTYKLNSDIYYAPFVIHDWQGDVIGPHEDMHWLKLREMTPTSEAVTAKLSKKRRAVAWFASNCVTISERETVVEKLLYALVRYDLILDVYGECGKRCGWGELMISCEEALEKDYYFYLAFEESLSEDYVTDEILVAMQHYAVPIVYGSANYSRFLPDGSYLNAKEFSPARLAREIFEIINDKDRYYDFFRWRNHYSYHKVDKFAESDNYCRFCEFVQDKSTPRQTINNFVTWWNDNPHTCVIRRVLDDLSKSWTASFPLPINSSTDKYEPTFNK